MFYLLCLSQAQAVTLTVAQAFEIAKNQYEEERATRKAEKLRKVSIIFYLA